MAKAQLKTQKNDASVADFIRTIPDETRQKDCQTVVELMEQVTGEKPVMWGAAIIGFGHYHYTYASGREGDWMLTAVSPRKQNLTVYIMTGFKEYPELMEKLGKHTTGKGCLYIKNLKDIDQAVLRKLIKKSVETMRKKQQ